VGAWHSHNRTTEADAEQYGRIFHSTDHTLHGWRGPDGTPLHDINTGENGDIFERRIRGRIVLTPFALALVFKPAYGYIIALVAGIAMWHFSIGKHARKMAMAHILSSPMLNIIRTSGRLDPKLPKEESAGHWHFENDRPYEIRDLDIRDCGRGDQAWALE